MLDTAFPTWFRRILFLLLLIFLISLQWQLWFGSASYRELSHLRERIAAQEASNQQLERTNNQLQAQVQDLMQGTDALEEVARHKLGLIREGEVFYMMVPANGN